MTMAIEADWCEATPATRAEMVARGARREGSAQERSGRRGEAPGVRYLYDEDGRILAEASVGPGRD